jgi:acyl carrier protein
MTNLEKYNKIFMETFEIEEKRLPEMKAGICAEWDSVAQWQLIALLENAFSINIEIDDVPVFTSYEKGKSILLKYNIIV